MPTNEKEYNGYLLDQLSAVERIERQVKKGDLKAVEEEIEILKNEINRKLYQQFIGNIANAVFVMRYCILAQICFLTELSLR